MTSQEILIAYVDMLYIISMDGIDAFKKWVDKNKDEMPISKLTIASSIIATFDILEKKEKK